MSVIVVPAVIIQYNSYTSGGGFVEVSALFRLFPSASLLVAHLGLNPDPNPNPNP